MLQLHSRHSAIAIAILSHANRAMSYSVDSVDYEYCVRWRWHKKSGVEFLSRQLSKWVFLRRFRFIDFFGFIANNGELWLVAAGVHRTWHRLLHRTGQRPDSRPCLAPRPLDNRWSVWLHAIQNHMLLLLSDESVSRSVSVLPCLPGRQHPPGSPSLRGSPCCLPWPGQRAVILAHLFWVVWTFSALVLWNYAKKQQMIGKICYTNEKATGIALDKEHLTVTLQYLLVTWI